MDEAMFGELNQRARVREREHRQRAKEAISESILEGGPKIKKEELLPVAVGDTNAINEVLPTLRKSSWRQYIPSWGHTKTNANEHNVCTTDKYIA